MRPEYIDAVESAQWGWSFRVTFLLPLFLVWSTVLYRPLNVLPKRKAIIALGFIAACLLFWIFTMVHLEIIQNCKEYHMRTTEERRDFSGDNPFACVTAIPIAVVYCAANLAAASLTFGSIRLVRMVTSIERGTVTDPHAEDQLN